MRSDRASFSDGLSRRGSPLGAPEIVRFPLRSRWQRHASTLRAALSQTRRWGAPRAGFLGL